MTSKLPHRLTNRLKRPEEVRAELERRGKTVRETAREIGVSEHVVRSLLLGRLRGRYGDAHRAAVLLGLKDGVVE